MAKKSAKRKGNRDAVVYVRLPDEDRERIAGAAAKRGLNVSTYVRMVLVERLLAEMPKRKTATKRRTTKRRTTKGKRS